MQDESTPQTQGKKAMFSLLNSDRRDLVEAAFGDEDYFVARFTKGTSGRYPTGSAIEFLCLPPYCRELVEEALKKEGCREATVYQILDKHFVTAKRGKDLLLANIPEPENHPVIKAVALRQTEPFKLKEFFTSWDGITSLGCALIMFGAVALFLFGPPRVLLDSVASSDKNFLTLKMLWILMCAGFAIAGLYFLFDLPINRWRWRRKTFTAIRRLG